MRKEGGGVGMKGCLGLQIGHFENASSQRFLSFSILFQTPVRRTTRLSLPFNTILPNKNNESKNTKPEQTANLRKRSARLSIQVDQLCTQSAKKRPHKPTTSELNKILEKSKRRYNAYKELETSSYSRSNSQVGLMKPVFLLCFILFYCLMLN